jgi:hypothetical protein
MTACCGEYLSIVLELHRREAKADQIYSYLRATKWNSAKAAIERLEGTLKWRREFGIYGLSADVVEPEVGFTVSQSPDWIRCSWT